jgi:hypothetical protein
MLAKGMQVEEWYVDIMHATLTRVRWCPNFGKPEYSAVLFKVETALCWAPRTQISGKLQTKQQERARALGFSGFTSRGVTSRLVYERVNMAVFFFNQHENCVDDGTPPILQLSVVASTWQSSAEVLPQKLETDQMGMDPKPIVLSILNDVSQAVERCAVHNEEQSFPPAKMVSG